MLITSSLVVTNKQTVFDTITKPNLSCMMHISIYTLGHQTVHHFNQWPLKMEQLTLKPLSTSLVKVESSNRCSQFPTNKGLYPPPPPPHTHTITKRHILQISSKIYDPLGLLSPVTVKAKLLMQEKWQDELEWDESRNG